MDATTWQIISIAGFSLFALFLIVAVFMFVRMNIPAIIGDLTGKTAEKQIQEIRERNRSTGNKAYQPGAFNLERGELTEPVRKSRKLGKTRGSTGGATYAGLDKGQTASTSKPIVLEKLQTDSFRERKPVGGTVNLESMTTGDVGMPKVAASSVMSDMQKLSDGTQVLSDSTQVLSDGTQVLVDGTQVLPDGTQVLTDGTQVLSDGTQVLVDGTQVLADGTQILSDGTQVLSDGTQVLADETQLLNLVGATTEGQYTGELATDEQVEEEFQFKIVKDVKIVHTDEVI